VSGLARPELMVEIEAVAAIVNGLEYINSHGGSVLAENDPSKVVIDSPESLAGLQMERSMLEDRIAPQAVANYTEQESQATFLRGDAVCLQHALPGQHRAAIGGNGANA
jgi:hypothetical protein